MAQRNTFIAVALAQPERLPVVQLLPPELVSGQCVHELQLPNVADGICFVCVFSVACCAPSRSSWKRRALGEGGRGCGALGRRCRGWQQESPPCSPQGQRLLGGTVSRTQRQPNELPWDWGGWRGRGRFGKPLSCAKLRPRARSSLRGAEGRAVYEAVSLPFRLMWSL